MAQQSNDRPPPRILPLGDMALTVEFGDAIAPDINDRVLTFAEALGDARLPGIEEVVPTYRSATVYFDSLLMDMQTLTAHVRDILALSAPHARRTGTTHTIPVLYGGTAGPDLEDVANRAGLTPDDIVTLHTSVVYRVYMLGFSPGFPYLGSVPDRLVMPRLATPRKLVAAGSVGLVGAQTGIYPQDSPGGWRIIGRTPARIFSLSGAKPFLLAPGDQVRFVSIDEGEFDSLSEDVQ